MTNGEELRTLRQKRQLTQCELAKRAGLTQSTIAHLEAGKRRYSVDSLQRIAKALRVSPIKLLPKS